MQEQAQIKISRVALEAIRAQESERELIILNELLANKSVIEDLIVGYHFSSRGRVYNIRISKPVLNEPCKGYFYVNYTLGHFNACADIDTNEEESMVIQLELDLNSGTARITGEYIPEREPDEF